MNILIIEDERKTAELLKEFIENKQGYLVVNILDSIKDTVLYLDKHQQNLNLLFLDIQLADGQSFEIFKQIQVDIPVIFCTAYDEFLLAGFKNNGIDYILKPFEEKDISKSLDKFEKLKKSFSGNLIVTNEQIQSLSQKERQYQKSFIVHQRDKMIPVQVENIAFFHLDNEVVYVQCFDHKKYSVFKRMDEIQSKLDRQLFFRINRQMIIHRDAVKEVEPYFNRKVIIKPTFDFPEKIIVSRLKVSPFLQWLEKPE